MKKNYIISLVILIVVLVFMLYSFFSPWYTANIRIMENNNHLSVEMNNYLTKIETTTKVNFKETSNVEVDYDEIEQLTYSTGNEANFLHYHIAFILMIFLIVLLIAGIIYVSYIIVKENINYSIIKQTRNTMIIIISILILSIFIFAISTQLFILDNYEALQANSPEVYDVLKGKMNFWSDYSTEYMGASVHITTGPAYSWYLLIVSLILCSFSFRYLGKNQAQKSHAFYYQQSNQTQVTNFCSECGAKKNINEKFCNQCGYKF